MAFKYKDKTFTHVRLGKEGLQSNSLRSMFRVNKDYKVKEFSGINVVIEGTYEDGVVPNNGISIEYFDLLNLQQAETTRADTKDTNPKDAVATGRIPLHLIPDGALAWVAMAFHEGATKYDPFNWRTAGVRASTYVAGARRHIGKWFNRVDYDEKSHVHHLANAIAGLMIVLDAEVQGLLTDDRPPKQDLEKLYKQLEEVQAHLTETFSKKE